MKKVSEKGKSGIFFVVMICALCMFIVHPFILYMDQEHHPILIPYLLWHSGESNG